MARTKDTQVTSMLSAAQRKYMIQRLDYIAEEKKQAQHQRIFGTPKPRYQEHDSFKPTLQQMVDAIKKGKATLKPEYANETGDITYYALDWKDQDSAVKDHKKKVEEYKKLVDLIVRRKERILDGVMLGSAEDALAALTEFANT